MTLSQTRLPTACPDIIGGRDGGQALQKIRRAGFRHFQIKDMRYG